MKKGEQEEQKKRGNDYKNGNLRTKGKIKEKTGV